VVQVHAAENIESRFGNPLEGCFPRILDMGPSVPVYSQMLQVGPPEKVASYKILGLLEVRLVQVVVAESGLPDSHLAGTALAEHTHLAEPLVERAMSQEVHGQCLQELTATAMDAHGEMEFGQVVELGCCGVE
jgi:hypothetical protein